MSRSPLSRAQEWTRLCTGACLLRRQPACSRIGPAEGTGGSSTWVDRSGVTQGTVGPPDEHALSSPELAPDGRRVAVGRTEHGNADVWLIDTSGDGGSRFTFKTSLEGHPLWSPDGLRVVFAARSRNASASVLFQKASSGAGEEEPLPAMGEFQTPFAWSSDGHLLYGIRHPKTGGDIWGAATGWRP